MRGGGKTDAGRVVMEVTQETGPCVFAFLRDRVGTDDISAFQPDTGVLRTAHSGIVSAVSQTKLTAATYQTPEQLGVFCLSPQKGIV